MSNARIGTTDKKFYALHIETLIKNVSLTIFLASTAIAEWLSKMQLRSTKNIFLMLPKGALLNYQTFCFVLFFSLEIFSYKIFKYKHISHVPLITKTMTRLVYLILRNLVAWRIRLTYSVRVTSLHIQHVDGPFYGEGLFSFLNDRLFWLVVIFLHAA